MTHVFWCNIPATAGSKVITCHCPQKERSGNFLNYFIGIRAAKLANNHEIAKHLSEKHVNLNHANMILTGKKTIARVV